MIQAIKRTFTQLSLIIILSLALLTPTDSIAYSCWNNFSAKQNRDNADYVFTGRIKQVTNEQKSSHNKTGHKSLSIAIAKIWKGDFKDKDYTTVIADDLYGYSFADGDKYLFYGYNLDNDNITIVGCPKSTPANKVQKDIRTLGKPIIDYTDENIEAPEFNNIDQNIPQSDNHRNIKLPAIPKQHIDTKLDSNFKEKKGHIKITPLTKEKKPATKSTKNSQDNQPKIIINPPDKPTSFPSLPTLPTSSTKINNTTKEKAATHSNFEEEDIELPEEVEFNEE